MSVILNLKRKSLKKTLLMCSVIACSFASPFLQTHKNMSYCVMESGMLQLILPVGGWFGGWWMELQNRLSEQVVHGEQGKRSGKVLSCPFSATVWHAMKCKHNFLLQWDIEYFCNLSLIITSTWQEILSCSMESHHL